MIYFFTKWFLRFCRCFPQQINLVYFSHTLKRTIWWLCFHALIFLEYTKYLSFRLCIHRAETYISFCKHSFPIRISLKKKMLMNCIMLHERCYFISKYLLITPIFHEIIKLKVIFPSIFTVTRLLDITFQMRTLSFVVSKT